MKKIIIFSTDLEDQYGHILFKEGIEYELQGNIVINNDGYGVMLEDLWVDYQVKVVQEMVH